MLLRSLRRRIQLRISLIRDESESGVALITAVGIMMVIIVITSVVLTGSVSAAGFATSTRASVQSKAAASGGIDAVRAQMLGGTFVCSLAGTRPTYSATVTYYDSSGNALSCAGNSLSGVPVSARIISAGTASSKGDANTLGDTAKEGADVAIHVTPGGVSLTQAVFSEGAMTLTNNTQINQSGTGTLDGNIYSNGSINCLTQDVIQGTIYARGGLTISNTCQSLGTVWVQGDVNLSASAVNLSGSVFATGNVALGVGHVAGNVIANGAITMSDASGIACPTGGNANVCGSVFSLGSGITFGQNGSIVLGSAYARNTIALGNRSNSPAQNLVSLTGGVTGSNSAGVGGTIKVAGTEQISTAPAKAKTCSSTAGYTPCTASDLVIPLPTGAAPSFAVELPMFSPANGTNLGTPTATTAVVAPARQAMPEIFSSPAALLANWSAWTKPAIAAGSALCSSSNQSWTTAYNNLMGTLPSGANVLLNFSACGGPVTLNGDTVTLNGNVAMMSPYGFNSSNNLNVRSSDGAVHQLMVIDPSDSASASGTPYITWTASDPTNYPGQLTPTCSQNTPNISINQMQVSNNDQIFLYTPCNVTITNNSTFSGQIYSGTASYPSGMNITRSVMNVPGVTIPGGVSNTASYSATITSRFDVSG